MSGLPALAVDNLNAWYGTAHILFDMSFTVGRGEVVALMGRNGAGKSTTMKAVMGLSPRRNGSVRLNGRDVSALKPFEIARLGMGFTPEDRRIFSDLTVLENLTVFARKAFLDDGADVAAPWTLTRIFEVFPALQAREGNLGFQLSGGEQQMLSIARALMLNPQLLLLDEPSEGLAPMIVQQIVEVLSKLKGEGLGILLVEQNLRTAFAVGDRHYVMNKGAICFSGSAVDLENNDLVLRNYLSV